MKKWDDYYCRGYGSDPDIARERLDFLRLEQERAMFNPIPPDEPLFYIKTLHPLSFDCPCPKCTSFRTPTTTDLEFLQSIGTTWE